MTTTKMLLTLHHMPPHHEAEVRQWLSGLFPGLQGSADPHGVELPNGAPMAYAWWETIAEQLEGLDISYHLAVRGPGGHRSVRYCPQLGRLDLQVDNSGQEVTAVAPLREIADLLSRDWIGAQQKFLEMTGKAHDLLFQHYARARAAQAPARA